MVVGWNCTIKVRWALSGRTVETRGGGAVDDGIPQMHALHKN